MNETTLYRIVSMTRAETSNSKSPMWRCLTLEGERVNVFLHRDPEKNSARLFEDAGYLEILLAMEVGQEITWRDYPVGVLMEKKGKWWEISEVVPRGGGAPDTTYDAPEQELGRIQAQAWARNLLNSSLGFVVWDVETTGLSNTDEIISIAAISDGDAVLLETLIKPNRMPDTSSIAVNGILPALLETAPTFAQRYNQIYNALAGKIWVVYNLDFDAPFLERQCLRYGLPPIHALGASCAMQQFASYHGEWNQKYHGYNTKKLSYAAEYLGIENARAHDALADCQTTLALIKRLADR